MSGLLVADLLQNRIEPAGFVGSEVVWPTGLTEVPRPHVVVPTQPTANVVRMSPTPARQTGPPPLMVSLSNHMSGETRYVWVEVAQ